VITPACEAVCDALSVTSTVKELLPAPTGIPVTKPELVFKLKPPGNAPALIE
jgi:hypothetical protein